MAVPPDAIHLDARETEDSEARETALLSALPAGIAHAVAHAPGWRDRLAAVDPGAVTTRAALAALPVLRKADLLALQRAAPPFGGFAAAAFDGLGRIFQSPGPLYEPEGVAADPWGAARALFAAGVRRGDLVHNTFAYHLTPGGWILDSGARALGATVIPAGPGATEAQVEAIATLRPGVYTGVPDFLKILLDKAADLGRDASSISRALVSGAALPASLRAELGDRGVAVLQCYAVAEVGVIAYESAARDGLIVNEDLIVEIVRPGTGDPVPDGEVGEVVVTRAAGPYPMIRLATGDLSAVMPGPSPCGRTNVRLRGWMGRADQRTKVKGMFVDPAQVDALVRRFPEVVRARLVVRRAGEQDAMTLMAEAAGGAGLDDRLAAALRDVTKLTGAVEIVAPGTLPNDGRVISDERPVG